MQIELLGIFDKFLKIPLIEMVTGGQQWRRAVISDEWLWVVIGVF